MYPLKAVLIAPPPQLDPGLAKELATHGVEVEATYNSVIDAVAALHFTKGVRLVIFHVETRIDVAELQQFHIRFPTWPIVTLIKGSVDPALWIDANRAGSLQVVPLPLQANDFLRALETVGMQYGYLAPQGVLIAISSCSGGAGATTIALNLATEISGRFGRTCLLADLSMQMGMLASYLDIQPRATLRDLIRDMHRLDADLFKKSLTPLGERLTLLPGSNEIGFAPQLKSPILFPMLETARRMHDVVVLDVPCTYDDWQFALLGYANHALLVADHSVPSLRCLKIVSEAVVADGFKERLQVIINRFSPDVQGLNLDDLRETLQIPAIHPLANDHDSMNRAANEGKALRSINANSPILRDLDALLLKGFGWTPGAPLKKSASGLFSRLVQAFKG
jgi:pilus assembly protein CpaE